jgi:carbon starvation protein
MNALFVLVLAVIAIVLGYGVYAKNINRTVIQPDDKRATPATMFMDGVDFTPANRHVLFGYQFKSVAALGPIVGPIVAIRWGWLPALLWIILGTFFIGWVQDYASIVVGLREEGRTFGALSYKLISPRARTILLVFIYIYLLLIMAAFGKQVGYDLMTNPSVPVGVLLVMVFGILAGQMTYKWKQDIIVTTVVTVVGSIAAIWIGTLPPVVAVVQSLNVAMGGNEKIFWSVIVLILCYFGGVLPIWRWAQPINYVSFWIVFLGILFGTLGLVIWHPGIPADFPAFTNWNGIIDPKLGPLGWMWPVLFVTIACGAVSGWHSLVSSSGTARQLEKETDALFVGGGSMFLEMFLACLSLLCAVVGIGASAGFAKYVELMAAGKTAGVFATGLSQFMAQVGIPTTFGLPYGSVFLTLMALTIMYLVVRFMRVASAEFLGDSIPAFRNVHVGSIVGLILSGVLIWTGFWSQIWVLFGGANQLMASLALLLISLWLLTQKKSYLWAFIPFIFMFITTIAALIVTIVVSFSGGLTVGKIIADVMGVVLIICALILAQDAILAIQKLQRAPAPKKAKAKAKA